MELSSKMMPVGTFNIRTTKGQSKDAKAGNGPMMACQTRAARRLVGATAKATERRAGEKRGALSHGKILG
jgi:hypothetical protein